MLRWQPLGHNEGLMLHVLLAGDTWGPFTAVRRPLSITLRAVLLKLQVSAPFWAEIFVLPRRSGWAERRRRGSFNKARFVQASPFLALQRKRDTRTKLHINRRPPQELLSYRTPTTSHQLPLWLRREKKGGQRCRGGRDCCAAPDEPKHKLRFLLDCPDDRLRRSDSSTVASS